MNLTVRTFKNIDDVTFSVVKKLVTHLLVLYVREQKKGQILKQITCNITYISTDESKLKN